MIILSAGHYTDAKGAVCGKYTEFPETLLWAVEVQKALADNHNLESRIIQSVKLRRKVKEVQLIARKFPVSCAAEIHFNSLPSGKASGSETLYYPGSKKGKVLAEAVQKQLATLFKDRGVKEGWYRQDRPGIVDYHGDVDGDEKIAYWLEKTPVPAIIIEPEFIQQWDDIVKHRVEASALIAKGLADYVEGKAQSKPKKKMRIGKNKSK